MIRVRYLFVSLMLFLILSTITLLNWKDIAFGGDELRQIHYSIQSIIRNNGRISKEGLVQPYIGQVITLLPLYKIVKNQYIYYHLESSIFKLILITTLLIIFKLLKIDDLASFLGTFYIFSMYAGIDGLMPVNSSVYLLISTSIFIGICLSYWLTHPKGNKYIGYFLLLLVLSIISQPLRIYGVILSILVVLGIVFIISKQKRLTAFVLIITVFGILLFFSKIGLFSSQGTASEVKNIMFSLNHWKQIYYNNFIISVLIDPFSYLGEILSGKYINSYLFNILIYCSFIASIVYIIRSLFQKKWNIIFLIYLLLIYYFSLLIPSIVWPGNHISITDRYLTLPSISLGVYFVVLLYRLTHSSTKIIVKSLYFLILTPLLMINLQKSLKYPDILKTNGLDKKWVDNFTNEINSDILTSMKNGKRPIIFLTGDDDTFIFYSIFDGEGRRFALLNNEYMDENFLPLFVGKSRIKEIVFDDYYKLKPEPSQIFGYRIENKVLYKNHENARISFVSKNLDLLK